MAIAKFKVLHRSDRDRHYLVVTKVGYSLGRHCVSKRDEGRESLAGRPSADRALPEKETLRAKSKTNPCANPKQN